MITVVREERRKGLIRHVVSILVQGTEWKEGRRQQERDLAELPTAASVNGFRIDLVVHQSKLVLANNNMHFVPFHSSTAITPKGRYHHSRSRAASPCSDAACIRNHAGMFTVAVDGEMAEVVLPKVPLEHLGIG